MTSQNDDDAELEPTADDVMSEAVQIEADRRLWVKRITEFVRGRSHDLDPCTAVQTAENLAIIAAYDRLARIMRSDEVAPE